MFKKSLVQSAALFAFLTGSPAMANAIPQDGNQAAVADAYAQFVPAPDGAPTRLEYSLLDEALEFMVLRMGPSTRQGERQPDPSLGTRIVYGHESRYRLEGNRILFSFLENDAIEPLTEYLRDLERLGTELDISSLSRNEQLAYWMNLHNVAVIEAIARNYPVQSPSRMKLGTRNLPLDQTKLVTIGGVSLSPQDIRTKIVFPNWRDPNVIYGFFRGEVGGPSIQRRAYTGENLAELLGVSAREFVNSLRGVESYGGNLLVSQIYEEAAPFYFPDMADDLRAHLATHAGDDVKELLAEKEGTKVNQYDDTIADLAAGDREPSYVEVLTNGTANGTRISPSIARLLTERREKMEKLRREGLQRGRVIVLPPVGSEEEAEANEAPEIQ